MELLLGIAALLLFPAEVQGAVRSSVEYCLTVLTPSLFPFMALVSYGVNSGAGEFLGRFLGVFSRRLFRLPSVCAAPILMSFLGGYPAGARAASLLLEQGKLTEKQAGRMMLFCVNPGVAFVVTFLGGAVLHSFRAGWVLFFSVTLSGLILGVLSGWGSPVPEKGRPAPTAGAQTAGTQTAGAQTAGTQTAGALIRSVTDACRSVTKMCACIVLFSGFTAVLHGSGAYQLLVRALSRVTPLTQTESAVALSFLIEVTGGVGDGARFRAGPVLYAFGLAFGGLCVHLQVFSFFDRFPVQKWKFFLFRFLHGFLSGGIAAAFFHFLPGGGREALAVSGAVDAVSPLSGTLAGGLSLLLMCVAFLLITSQTQEERKV